MKVEALQKQNAYKPFSISITFETEDDARKFYSIFSGQARIDLSRDCQILRAMEVASDLFGDEDE